MTDPMEAIEAAVASVTDPHDDTQIVAALRSVSPALVDDVIFGAASSTAGSTADGVLLGVGVAASPGVGVGRVALSAAEALKMWESGTDIVFVTGNAHPADEPAIRVASAVVTHGGGTTCHAALIARQWGVPAVCGVGEIEVSAGSQMLVDGSTGEVRALDGVSTPAEPRRRPLDRLPEALTTLLGWADGVANHRIKVLANADVAADAELATTLGAAGVGLCRTERHFAGERASLIERVIAGDDDARAETVKVQRARLFELFVGAGTRSTVVRLLDASRHEFDPTHPEHNPMAGLRGIRLMALHPQLLVAQVEAIAHAMADLREHRRVVPDVAVLLPLVSMAPELEWARTVIKDVFFQVGLERGVDLAPTIGVMIETPRAALVAASLARHCDFLAFGTNDLTQLTYGFSRDDLDADLVPAYIERDMFDRSPFETLDGSGVVRLMALAAETGRAQNPTLGLSLCGEHGGDPPSTAIAVQLGIDSVSVAPHRVPATRLAAAHAVLGPVGAGGPG